MPGMAAAVQRLPEKPEDIVAAGGKIGLVSDRDKKEPPLPAALSDNREASNRVDRSHSMSKGWTMPVMKGKA
jgi:hypothetical protein